MLKVPSTRFFATALVTGLAVLGVACSSEPPPPPATSVPAAPPVAPAAPAAAPKVPAAPKVLQWDNPPAMEIDVNKKYSAVFEMAKGEEFTVELYAKEVPTTVNSFVFLARQGFYDGVTFHRVLAGFMAQGGDPTGIGTGGPGYRFDNEIHPDLHHDAPGILSMANAGMRDGKGTNGSQFFIMFGPEPRLDGHGKDCDAARVSCHAVFGKVTEGIDVVNNLTLRDPQRATAPGDAMKTIRIIEE